MRWLQSILLTVLMIGLVSLETPVHADGGCTMVANGHASYDASSSSWVIFQSFDAQAGQALTMTIETTIAVNNLFVAFGDPVHDRLFVYNSLSVGVGTTHVLSYVVPDTMTMAAYGLVEAPDTAVIGFSVSACPGAEPPPGECSTSTVSSGFANTGSHFSVPLSAGDTVEFWSMEQEPSFFILSTTLGRDIIFEGGAGPTPADSYTASANETVEFTVFWTEREFAYEIRVEQCGGGLDGLSSIPAPSTTSFRRDGRLNDACVPVAIYWRPSGDIQIYAVDPASSQGVPAVTISQDQVAAVGVPEDAHALLGSGTNPFTGHTIDVYRLTTGAFQINTTYPDGKPYVFAWDTQGGSYHLAW